MKSFDSSFELSIQPICFIFFDVLTSKLTGTLLKIISIYIDFYQISQAIIRFKWISQFLLSSIPCFTQLQVDFNIFGDAESESAIIFHVRPIGGLKLDPKKGVKFKVFNKVFDRNNSYIDFNIFGDAESESAIIFISDLSVG